MTYYRLAVQDRQSTHWIWKTTPLTSLQAVFQVLRSYAALPQDDIRVFTAFTKEGLNEMLSHQNNYLVPGSVTATQFLRERKIAGGEQLQNASDQRVPSQANQQETESVAWATWKMQKAAQSVQQADDATWAKEVWEKHRALQANQQEVRGVATRPLLDRLAAQGTISSLGMSMHDKKRLEIELGPGGDHDMPYLFTLPISQKEQLAWIRLQKQVQAGELLP